MAADPEATLPALTEAVKRLTTDDRKRAFQDRGAKLAAASQKALERARVDATYGWDASPISTARLSAEVWNAVKNEDWAGGSGRYRSGITTSTISAPAAAAPAAWDSHRPPQWARRWRIARTGGCMCIFRPTAI